MYFAMAAILGVLWVMGMISGAPLGAWVHLFLVMALISSVIAVARSGGSQRRGIARRAGP